MTGERLTGSPLRSALRAEPPENEFAFPNYPIAERVRKIGGTTLRSIGQIGRLQRIADNEANYVEPEDMLAELCEDNKTLAARLREAHKDRLASGRGQGAAAQDYSRANLRAR